VAREIDAKWPITNVIRVGATWTSGYYIANLVLLAGPSAGRGTSVPFIVKAPLLEPSRILVQAPVNTWQAYNSWGGESLYGGTNGPAHMVSFNRPYSFRPSIRPLLVDEYPLVRFLEQRGYDVSYTTNVDVDSDPGELLHHRLFISVAHDEYWTKGIRDGLDRARDLGTNLAFVGGNDGYWQVRYADDRRTLVEYRSAVLDPDPNPAEKTVSFRSLGRPECELVGVEYQGGLNPANAPAQDYAVVPSALTNPWFRNTGFAPTSAVKEVVGHEGDAVVPDCDVPRPTVLFHYQAPRPADAVGYTATSGARVFAAGSIDFDWALMPHSYRQMGADTRLHQFMANALRDLERPAGATNVQAWQTGRRVVVQFDRSVDPRVHGFRVVRFQRGTPASQRMRIVCRRARLFCASHVPRAGGRYRYAVYAADSWGDSIPRFTHWFFR